MDMGHSTGESGPGNDDGYGQGQGFGSPEIYAKKNNLTASPKRNQGTMMAMDRVRDLDHQKYMQRRIIPEIYAKKNNYTR
ncbi:hypothetical protein QE152_g1865 [Popillia japonica]|uniref:Uncharacterized protein n=1 Tax=Popillia japonica TaxID=7064 RepID=A0AAW1N5H0_POPJA